MNETEKELEMEMESVETETVTEPAVETAVQVEDKPVASGKHGYENGVARVLRKVYGGGLVVTVVYLLSQLALTFSSYFAQKSQFDMYLAMGQDVSQQATALSMSLYYALAGVIMPVGIMAAASFLFLFFAEMVELTARKTR